MTDDLSDITADDVPPNPVAAYQCGYRAAQKHAKALLSRLCWPPITCCNGHEIWLHNYFDGKSHRAEYLRFDGTIDECCLGQ